MHLLYCENVLNEAQKRFIALVFIGIGTSIIHSLFIFQYNAFWCFEYTLWFHLCGLYVETMTMQNQRDMFLSMWPPTPFIVSFWFSFFSSSQLLKSSIKLCRFCCERKIETMICCLDNFSSLSIGFRTVPILRLFI